MAFEAIEILQVIASAAPYERLGLTVDRRPRFTGFHVGSVASSVRVSFYSSSDWAKLHRSEPASGLHGIIFRVADLPANIARMKAAGVPVSEIAVGFRHTFIFEIRDAAGVDLILTAPSPPLEKTGVVHAFPLKRLDHLAAVAHNLDEKCRFWEDVLGVPVVGEVPTPTMIIRQLKIGDAIFELLGPAGQDSPIHKRPAGLVSMAAWEVDDLPTAVAQARAAGFTVPDPAAGVLPGTRTATIPAAELGGVAMQLLQYV
jgi:catechol 2,3-dioxygenase-like lactoylglutathione lyase family enzyme